MSDAHFTPYWTGVLREHLAILNSRQQAHAKQIAASIPALKVGQRWELYAIAPPVRVVAVGSADRTGHADVTCEWPSGRRHVFAATAFISSRLLEAA